MNFDLKTPLLIGVNKFLCPKYKCLKHFRQCQKESPEIVKN